MAGVKKCCKTCKFMEVPLTETGIRRVQKDKFYACHALIPPVTNLPWSVIRSREWRDLTRILSITKPKVRGGEEADCPAWEALG